MDIEIFDSAGNSLFGKTTFTSATDAGVTNLGLSGGGYVLTLGEFAVSPTTDPLFAELTFRAFGSGTNTREELIAWVQPSAAVPLPAGALLIVSAFAAAGLARRVSRRAA